MMNLLRMLELHLSDIEEALAGGNKKVMDKKGQCFSTPIKDWISPTRWTMYYWCKFYTHPPYLIYLIYGTYIL